MKYVPTTCPLHLYHEAASDTLGDLATVALATALRTGDGRAAEQFNAVLVSLSDNGFMAREVSA